METGRRARRANLFDASALVKVFANEPHSDRVREHFRTRHPTYTTPFCFYESLSILKARWMGRRPNCPLTRNQYFDATKNLFHWFQATNWDIRDIDFNNHETFEKVREVAQLYELDLSDALQLVSLTSGYFSPLVNGSQTLLVTADEALATAARSEYLKVWCCLTERDPPQ